MRTERRRLLMLVASAVTAVVLGAVFLVLVRAQHVLNRAAVQNREAGLLPYSLRSFDPESRRAANPGFEYVTAASGWTHGVQLGDSLYLSGPAGLAEYAGDKIVHLWRSGVELPPVPITALTVGRLRGSAEPQVVLGTDGAGVLVLTPGPHPEFAQMLPGDGAMREVTALAASSTGDLLVGTRHAGLLIFSGDNLTAAPIHVFGVDAGRMEVTALAMVGPAVVIGTRGEGAIYLHGGTALQVTPAELPDAEIESIAANGTHAYLGTPVGVAEMELTDGRITRTLAAGLFAHTLAVSGGMLTVGTLDQGIRQVPLVSQPHLRPVAFGRDVNAAGPRVDALVSAEGGLLALAGGAVLRGDSGGWVPWIARADAGLTDPNVSALTLAPDGRLWVGLFDRGLDVVDPASMTRVRHLEDDALFCVDRLAVDPIRHTVAAATANGLVLFDTAGNPRQTLTRRDGLIADHINDVVFTEEGAVLATPAGITFLKDSGAESLYAFQGLVNNHVYTLARSTDGRELLAGTLGGISLLESEQVRRNLTATNSPLRHNWITAAIPVEDGTWLVGTYGAGLATLHAGRGGDVSVVPAELPADAPGDLIINPNALLATPTAIYAGTLDHGMLVYSFAGRRWSIVTKGLPSLNVTAFAAGGGTLYVGTENGLVRIAETRLAGGAR